MWSMLWPIALVILSNCVYNICTKSTPSQANAFLSLAVTYLTAAALAAALFLWGGHSEGFLAECRKLNWTSLVLAVSVVALEFGYISLYRAGWKVHIGSLVANIGLACALVFVGALLYRESVSPRQLLGMAVCVAGLILING